MRVIASLPRDPPPSAFRAGAAAVFGAIVIGLIAALSSQPASAAPLTLEPTATLSIPDPNYTIVHSVAIHGDYLVMGAADHRDDTDIGPHSVSAAFLFHRQSNGTWSHVQTLTTGTGAVGFETSVAIRGNLIAVHWDGVFSVFERTSSGWHASPVDPDFSNPSRGGWSGDVEIAGDTIVLGGGPEHPSGYCGAYTLRTFRKNSSGTWSVVGTAMSEPAAPYEGCRLRDVAISSNSVVLPAQRLADDSSATYIFTGTSPISSTFVRIADHAAPVAIENNVALLSGTEVFRHSSGTWLHDQTLPRPDLPYASAQAAELRNGLAAVAFGKPLVNGLVDGRSVSVFRPDASNRYLEVARLTRPGHALTPTAVDISGRRIVTNDIHEGKALVYQLPTNLTAPNSLQETFDTGNGANWTPLAGSSWSVVPTPTSRIYRQSSLAGDAGAFLANTNWTNQSVQADVRATAFSGNDRWFGLAVRRSDAANYYYVTARSSNVVQLKKMANGTFQTLASASLPVTVNKTYRLRLEAIGTTLRVYVDDELLLQAIDSSHQQGQTGLLMYKTAADYDNVVVTPSTRLTLLQDDFPYIDTLHWNPSAGSWAPSGGEYRQSSVAGDARSVAGTAVEDQSLRARVMVTSTSGNDRWVGLFTRYVDAQNYYYVTLRTSNSISLRKLVNGSIHVLDVAPLNVAIGHWYDVRLEAIQDRLRVYVNGEMILEAADSTFSEGRYGLVTYKASAAYDDVLATQP